MIQPEFAVIVLNYFGLETTKKCIDSVFRELNATVFLVDNSSNAIEKQKLIESFQSNAKVKLLFPNENLGFAAGVNLALKEAVALDFEYFFLLNNDATLKEGSGSEFSSAVVSNPASLISSLILWSNNTVGKISYHKYLSLLSYSGKHLDWIQYLSGCVQVFDKTLLQKTGYFNETFFMYGEDISFSYDVSVAGLPLVLLEKELVIHEGSSAAKKASFFYEYHVNRGHVLLVQSLSNNLIDKVVMYIARLFMLTLKGLLRSFRFKSFTPIAGSLLAWLPLKVRPKTNNHN